MSVVELPSEPCAVDGAWAVIFHVWQDEPIFHDLAPGRRTLCGRAVGVYHPLLPLKHARKIGVPCKGCRPRQGS
jgi:hypothetical protein